MPEVHQLGKLPGTESSFHEMRLYMTPMTYKGKKILAFHAACKQEKCRFSSAWATSIGRDLGIFKHRSEAVLKERRKFFKRHYTNASVSRIEKLVTENADRNSHSYENWVEIVESLHRTRTGDGEFEIDPENSGLKVDYYRGYTARRTAYLIFVENFG